MIVRNGNGYGYGAYGEGWLDAVLAAVPAVMSVVSPKPVAPVVVQQPSNMPMILGVGLGGLLIVGAMVMLVRR